MGEAAIVGVVGASVLVGVILLGLVLAIVSYILFAIGLGTIAKREGKANSWLSWIPFAQWYLMADIVKGKKFVKSGALALFYTLTPIIIGVTIMVIAELIFVQGTTSKTVCNIIGYILVILASAYIWLLHYYVLDRYTKHALVLTLLGVFVSDAVALVGLYTVRNNEFRGANPKSLHELLEEID